MHKHWIPGALGFAVFALVLLILYQAGWADQPAAPPALSSPSLLNTIVVTSTADSGAGTLRQALLDAGVGDTITFSPTVFPPDGITIISPQSPLPQIVTDELTIDASDTRVVLDGDQVGTTPETVLLDDVRLIFDDGGDVLVNGGFEAGLGHWRPADEGSGATRSINTGDSHSPSNSYQWDVVAQSAEAYTVYDRTDSSDPIDDAFEPGSTTWITATDVTTVALRFWYKGQGVSVMIRLLYPDDDGALGVWSFGDQANWTEAVISETLPTETIAVGLRFGLVHSLWGTPALSISADRTAIRGLWIAHFPGNGIELHSGARENVIGGENTAPGGMCSGACNMLAANLRNGVELRDSGTMSNTISGNYIGTSASGTIAAGNGWEGVLIANGTSHNTVGGDTPGERNLISGNAGGAGILIKAAMANTVSGNYIGTDVSGTYALANAEKGCKIEGGAGNVVGGSTPGARNLISGNNEDGVHLEDGAAHNVVSGNYIGTDASGTSALPNTTNGVRIDESPQNLIGGGVAAERNLISGNLENGVRIEGSASTTNTISANYIGTDLSGTSPVPNGTNAIAIDAWAAGTTVGGTTPGTANLLSGNNWIGVFIRDSSDNQVVGNRIGIDASGIARLSNDVGVGIYWSSKRNLVEGNVLSGNRDWGIQIALPEATNNVIRDNWIGTNEAGLPLGNDRQGIEMTSEARDNTIGPGNVIQYNGLEGVFIGVGLDNTIVGNEIAYNTDDGVLVFGENSLRNTITANSLYGNGDLGIDLQDGANAGLASPAVLDYDPAAGTANGTACANCTVEVFSDYAEEGRWFEATTTADGSGNWSVSAGSAFSGPRVTATATDLDGNTSEFSDALPLTCTVTSTADSGPGTLRTCLQNAVSGDRIGFDPGVFPPSSPATITLLTPLPWIEVDHLTIDGSEAGVILDGDQVPDTGAAQSGFIIRSAHNVIRGLQIVNFPYYGIEIWGGGQYNTIGGDRTLGSGPVGQGLLVSGNCHGIQIASTTALSNTILGTYVGTDAAGAVAVSSRCTDYSEYIQVGGSYNRVGSTLPGERNVFAGIVYIAPPYMAPKHNQIVGNHIGVDASGTACLGNGYSGLVVWGSGHIIGGDTPEKGNLICGFEHAGVSISGSGSRLAHNVIYGNDEVGVRVGGTEALTNTLTHNSIYGNGGPGIELVDGGNAELAAPTVLDYDPAAGTASGTACPNCTIEVFSDGDDEGRWYEGTVTAGGGGAWSFDKGSAFTGVYVHATATDAGGNTSAFSVDPHDVAVVGAAPDGSIPLAAASPVRAELLNQGPIAEEGVPVICSIADPSGSTVYSETALNGEIPPGTWAVVEFPAWTPSVAGDHLLTCQSQLPGDGVPGNDTYSQVVTVAGGVPDVWTMDNDGDTGDVPTEPPWWVSPDVWVRHQPDGGLVHQNPIARQENTVYVRLRNRGDAPASGEVAVFWDRSRLSWPCDQGAPNVGTIPFQDLAPGEVRIVSLTWVPRLVGQHGLYTVVDAEGDPANWDAICSPHAPRYDNNVSWRNVVVFAHASQDLRRPLEEDGAEVQIVNPYDRASDVDLVFDRMTFPATGTVQVAFPAALFDRWQAYPAGWSEGVEVLAAASAFRLTGAISATIGAIPLWAGEAVTVTLAFDAPAGQAFELRAYQRIHGLTVGGVAYQWLVLDSTPPEVESTSPADGATGVAPGAPLVVTFSEPIGPLSFVLSLSPDPGGWQMTWNEGGTEVTAWHAAFAAGTTYHATVSANDAWGNALAQPATWSFTTLTDRHVVYLPLVSRTY
jgi:hypothetical protein